MDTKKGLLIIAIILIIISAITCIFGYRIREIWPTTHGFYEMDISYIIGALGIFFWSKPSIKPNQEKKYMIT